MDPRRREERTAPRKGLQDVQPEIVAEAFLELFELLEAYAPMWYTEQQRKRALAVLRLLGKAEQRPRFTTFRERT